MTAPPGGTPALASASTSSRSPRVGDDPRFAAWMKVAYDDPALTHLSVRALQSRVRRALVEKIREADLITWLAERPQYPDPTGETAVRNVTRERAQ